MAHWNPVDQIQDLVNKFGGEDRIKRFQSGELVLVDRNVASAAVSPQGLANGGVTFEETTLNIEAFLDDQARFLREVFRVGMPGKKKLVLPKQCPGFGWGIVRVPDLSAQRIFDILTIKFSGKTFKWCSNIDEALDSSKEVRTMNKGSYIVWCRDRVEADEEHKNRSANDLARLGINCMTAIERIQLEGWFNWKTDGHLDINNITLSAGSRCLAGDVPSADWRSEHGFYVGRGDVDYRHSDIRAREVVSI